MKEVVKNRKCSVLDLDEAIAEVKRYGTTEIVVFKSETGCIYKLVRINADYQSKDVFCFASVSNSIFWAHDSGSAKQQIAKALNGGRVFIFESLSEYADWLGKQAE